ncbi:MAG: insulinase family protein [Spirochaetales bacterium]|nr:insulinase family protein [Spirochaetales bacterium]
MVLIRQLEGGTILLLEQVSTTETASIGFWFTHGSRDEKDNEHGYAHFLEHMLFKGTERRNAFTIAQEIDRVGGVLNGFTEKECSCYYCTIPGNHIRLAIDVLGDIVFHSVLSEAEIEKEKNVVINEIQISLDSPEEVAYEYFLKEMWGTHPLSLSITGTVPEVKSITRERLDAFYRERYTPSNLIIAVSGNFDIDDVTESIESVTANAGGGRFSAERIKPVRRPSWKSKWEKFKQVHLYAGTCDIACGEIKDYYTLLLFSTIFGESMSSRLYQMVREEEGLCYTIYSFRTIHSDSISWTMYANTRPLMIPQLIRSIDNVCCGFLSNHVSEDELKDAKNHLKGGLIIAREDMEGRMKRLFKLYLISDKILEFEDSIRMIESVGLKDIENVTRNILKADNFNLLAFGNIKNSKVKGERFTFS